MEPHVYEARVVERLAETPRLAYNLTCAAYALCISKRTLRREIIAGEIVPLETSPALIDHDELVRWIKERKPKPTPRTRARRFDAPRALAA